MAADGNPEINLEPGIVQKAERSVREPRWKVRVREKWGTWRQTWNHPNAVVEVQSVCKREMGALEREIFLQVDLYAEEVTDPTGTKEKKRKARAALTTWIAKIELIKRLKLERESKMRSIMNEVYNLVSLYSVFVGVVLTAVATSSRLECQHLWSPVGLSFFAYIMVVTVALTKFREIGDLEEKKEINKQKKKEIKTQVQTLMNDGYARFEFGGHCKKEWRLMQPVLFSRNALGLIVPLTIFTAGLVFSLGHILCWS